MLKEERPLGPRPHTTSPIRVERVDHVGVLVTDIDAAVTWYVEALGFTVADRWSDQEARMAWAHLELDGVRVEFVQAAALESPKPATSGFHHLALVVPDCADAVLALVAAGATVISPPSYFDRHDMDWSFVRDPFENTIEVVSYRT